MKKKIAKVCALSAVFSLFLSVVLLLAADKKSGI